MRCVISIPQQSDQHESTLRPPAYNGAEDAPKKQHHADDGGVDCYLVPLKLERFACAVAVCGSHDRLIVVTILAVEEIEFVGLTNDQELTGARDLSVEF